MKAKLIKISLIVLLLSSLVIPQVLLGPTSNQALAQEPPPEPEPPFEPFYPGRVQGTGTFFEIQDSESANITLASTEEVKVDLESIPRMISLIIEAAGEGTDNTVLTLEGLEPNKTYYKYEDDFGAGFTFLSDENGSYVWTQDLIQPHLVWIQEEAATINIPDQASTYGTWDEATRTFTLGQDLTQTVWITEGNITVDGNGHTVRGTGSGVGIAFSGITDVIVKNFNVEEFSYGFRPNSVSNVTLSNNTASSNFRGIVFVFSSNSTLNSNNVLSNSFGIEISISSNITLNDNIVSNHWSVGIDVIGGHNHNLNNNNVSFSWCGLNLGSSDNNHLKGNDISDNWLASIITYSSHNTFENNIALRNLWSVIGMFRSSNSNTFSSNTFSNTSAEAIWLQDSSNNTFYDNTISNNLGIAILIDGDSYDNTIRNNTISNNRSGIHVCVPGDSNNRIYHNSFIDNVETPQAYVYQWTTGVLFDDGYPSGGNYWSDYTGVDLYSGPNQNQPGSDGIGDISYIINDFQDGYPLMFPPTLKPEANFDWTPEDPGPGENITFDASSSVGEIVSYDWDFGDNTTGENVTITHAYQNPDDYNVQLVVTTSDNETASANKTVIVRPWSFAIITDVHIGRNYADYGGIGYEDYGITGEESELDYYLTERLEAAVNWINNNKNNSEYNIDFVVVMGDEADSAERAELLKAKYILDKLNDPNGDGDTDDGIPYVPVFGNHDIWPYTKIHKAYSSLRGKYFEDVFWTDNSTTNKNLELLRSITDNFTKPTVVQEDSYYHNFYLRYKGVNFIGLDFSHRESSDKPDEGVEPQAVYYPATRSWLEERINDLASTYDGAEPVILLSHNPMVDDQYSWSFAEPITGVSVTNGLTQGERSDIENTLNTYENLYEGKQVLGNFAGHIHAIEQFGYEFFDANFIYDENQSSYMYSPIITTEALMVGSNLKNTDLQNVDKGIIRIVKITSAGEMDYSTIKGEYDPDTPTGNQEFIALNPRIGHTIGNTYPWVYLKANTMTKRDVALYSWDFGDGISHNGSQGIWHEYPTSGVYTANLTVADSGTGKKEYITQKIVVLEEEDWPTPWYIELWEDIEAFYLSMWEKATEFGRIIKDTLLFFRSHSPAKPVGLATIHFEQASDNINMTSLVADYDTAVQKSIFYMPVWPSEVEEAKALLIPYSENGTVYVCPQATSLEEVNPLAPGVVFLEPGEIADGMMALPITYEGEEYYLIQGFVNGGGGVNLPPVADADGPYSGEEGSPIIFTSVNSTDPNGDPLKYRWDFNNDGIWDTDWLSEVTANCTWYDDHTGDVALEVWDGEFADTATAVVNVSNVSPSVGEITAPLTPVELGTEISANATFTDPGTDDTHVAIWDWGDSSTSEGIINESEGSVGGNHTYSAAGVYTVTLTVTDDDSGSGESVFRYIVIYDPGAGFVTGGGWINSPEGAYTADPLLTGKANLGFNCKYQQGGDVPTGQTRFHFKEADLKLHSTGYEWLVINGAKAIFKGEGTINGEGSYKFQITVIDDDVDSNDSYEVDLFRIKIWEEIDGNEVLIYDSALGDDSDEAMAELGGGSIKIH